MATRAQKGDAGRMTPITPTRPDMVASAHRLDLAAAELLELAGMPEAVAELPETLDHLETALDRIATSLVKMSQSVAEWSGRGGAITDYNALPPAARALRWHLHDVAARVGASSNACPGARQWAGDLLADPAAVRDREVAIAWGADRRSLHPQTDFAAPPQARG